MLGNISSLNNTGKQGKHY